MYVRHAICIDMQGALIQCTCTIPGLHTSIWQPDICIWQLFFTNKLLSIGPFPKELAPKTSLQGPLWPSSKIFWMKH